MLHPSVISQHSLQTIVSSHSSISFKLWLKNITNLFYIFNSLTCLHHYILNFHFPCSFSLSSPFFFFLNHEHWPIFHLDCVFKLQWGRRLYPHATNINQVVISSNNINVAVAFWWPPVSVFLTQSHQCISLSLLSYSFHLPISSFFLSFSSTHPH